MFRLTQSELALNQHRIICNPDEVKSGEPLESPSLNFVNDILWLLALLVALAVGIWFGRYSSTGRKSRSLESQESRSKLVQATFDLMELVSNTALLLNPSNMVVKATPQIATMGLVRGRELTNKNIEDLANRVRQGEQTEEFSFEVSTGLGSNGAFVDARAALIESGYVLVVLTDRTEAKKLEDTRRDFIANISHELKTPIGAISLLAEAISEASDDPAAVEKFVKNLSKESKRLSRLVNDVIQLSRIQSSDAVTNPELIDLSVVASEAVERNSFLAEKRDVTIALDAPEGIEVWGDFEMLAVAAKNLIENAILYSEEGSKVGVGIKAEEGIASLSVTDSGRGIPVDEQQRIFERFYRVDPSRSRGTGGTGLGLSIVRNVAASHNGEVTVFSKPGVGSTFTLRLPIADRQILSDPERNFS
jgi:two-component system sensor histidine kinase SenX3